MWTKTKIGYGLLALLALALTRFDLRFQLLGTQTGNLLALALVAAFTLLGNPWMGLIAVVILAFFYGGLWTEGMTTASRSVPPYATLKQQQSQVQKDLNTERAAVTRLENQLKSKKEARDKRKPNRRADLNREIADLEKQLATAQEKLADRQRQLANVATQMETALINENAALEADMMVFQSDQKTLTDIFTQNTDDLKSKPLLQKALTEASKSVAQQLAAAQSRRNALPLLTDEQRKQPSYIEKVQQRLAKMDSNRRKPNNDILNACQKLGNEKQFEDQQCVDEAVVAIAKKSMFEATMQLIGMVFALNASPKNNATATSSSSSATTTTAPSSQTTSRAVATSPQAVATSPQGVVKESFASSGSMLPQAWDDVNFAGRNPATIHQQLANTENDMRRGKQSSRVDVAPSMRLADMVEPFDHAMFVNAHAAF